MRPCPFCGDYSAQYLVIRMVCRNCGAAGPIDEDSPDIAWDTRAESTEVGESEIHVFPGLGYEDDFGNVVWDFPRQDDHLYTDGSSASIRQAFAIIFSKAKRHEGTSKG